MDFLKYCIIIAILPLFHSCQDERPICSSSKINIDLGQLQQDKQGQPWSRPMKLMFKGKSFSGDFKFCEDDKLYFEGKCEDGKLNGTGKLFIDDEVYVLNFKDGMLHGNWKRYSFNETLLEEGNFLYQKQHGPYKFYNDGSLWQECNFIDDNIEGDLHFYQEDGKEYSTITYKKGIITNCSGDCDGFRVGHSDFDEGYPRYWYKEK